MIPVRRHVGVFTRGGSNLPQNIALVSMDAAAAGSQGDNCTRPHQPQSATNFDVFLPHLFLGLVSGILRTSASSITSRFVSLCLSRLSLSLSLSHLITLRFCAWCMSGHKRTEPPRCGFFFSSLCRCARLNILPLLVSCGE